MFSRVFVCVKTINLASNRSVIFTKMIEAVGYLVIFLFCAFYLSCKSKFLDPGWLCLSKVALVIPLDMAPPLDSHALN